MHDDMISATGSSNDKESAEGNIEFENFKKKFGKAYADLEEENMRKMLFRKNLK